MESYSRGVGEKNKKINSMKINKEILMLRTDIFRRRSRSAFSYQKKHLDNFGYLTQKCRFAPFFQGLGFTSESKLREIYDYGMPSKFIEGVVKLYYLARLKEVEPSVRLPGDKTLIEVLTSPAMGWGCIVEELVSQEFWWQNSLAKEKKLNSIGRGEDYEYRASMAEDRLTWLCYYPGDVLAEPTQIPPEDCAMYGIAILRCGLTGYPDAKRFLVGRRSEITHCLVTNKVWRVLSYTVDVKALTGGLDAQEIERQAMAYYGAIHDAHCAETLWEPLPLMSHRAFAARNMAAWKAYVG